jgi:hypothetical protein
MRVDPMVALRHELPSRKLILEKLQPCFGDSGYKFALGKVCFPAYDARRQEAK